MRQGKLRILVVGGSGRIGRLLRRAWACDGVCEHEFVFQTRDAEATGQDITWAPLTSNSSDLQRSGPFDVMLVLAGVTPGPNADFSLNSKLATACVAAAQDLGIARVLLASTSAVYGTHLNRPIHEADPPRPTAEYGRSKRAMEIDALDLAADPGVELCCLRIGNVAGADMLLINGSKLAPGECLKLDHFRNGGTPLRSYIGPITLAKVIAKLCEETGKLPEVLNVATPKAVEMLDLAQVAGFPTELVTASVEDHQYVTLDCTALSQIYPFSPTDWAPETIVQQWLCLRKDT